MHNDEQQHAIEQGHEPFGLSNSAVAKGFSALYALIIVSLLLMAGLMVLFTKFAGGDATVDAPDESVVTAPGVPKLTPNQSKSLRELRLQERKVLTEYAWIDEQAGVARIPIKRAMELLSRSTAASPGIPDDAAIDP